MYINKTVSCRYIRLSFLQLHLRCERLKRQCARYLLVQLSETAVCQRLKITRRRHREKHTDFMLLHCCWIAEFWTRHGSIWIMIDRCMSKHTADSQEITAARTMSVYTSTWFHGFDVLEEWGGTRVLGIMMLGVILENIVSLGLSELDWFTCS